MVNLRDFRGQLGLKQQTLSVASRCLSHQPGVQPKSPLHTPPRSLSVPWGMLDVRCRWRKTRLQELGVYMAKNSKDEMETGTWHKPEVNRYKLMHCILPIQKNESFIMLGLHGIREKNLSLRNFSHFFGGTVICMPPSSSRVLCVFFLLPTKPWNGV